MLMFTFGSGDPFVQVDSGKKASLMRVETKSVPVVGGVAVGKNKLIVNACVLRR